MIEASDVFLTSCTMKPTVGGVAMRTDCGSTTCRICSRYEKPSAAEPCHCDCGTAWIEPRQISPKYALAYAVSATVTEMNASWLSPNSARPKNTRNSSISS